jgi:undecaprenyl-diphosphatase
MWEQIWKLDHLLFHWINDQPHPPWLDEFMRVVSGSLLWPVLVLGFLAWRRWRQRAWEWRFVITAGLAVGISDAVSTYLLKPNFQRLRPCRQEDLIVRIVDSCSGQFGFPSNHAANGMALTLIFLAYFGKTKMAYFCLLVPILVSLSRIYLGVHFPGDVLAGSALGAAIAAALLPLKKHLQQIRA